MENPVETVEWRYLQFHRGSNTKNKTLAQIRNNHHHHCYYVHLMPHMSKRDCAPILYLPEANIGPESGENNKVSLVQEGLLGVLEVLASNGYWRHAATLLLIPLLHPPP